MINRITIKGFKRFEEVSFDIRGHVVLAGPNNTGKTTVLQAIAAWGLALERWKQLNNFHRRGGAYQYAPVTRQTFSAVPLKAFDLLWRDRSYHGVIVITLQLDGDAIPIEFIPNSTEQIYVRPLSDVEPDVLRETILSVVFVPSMTGLSTEEPVYTAAKVKQLLGMAKPGDVIRNLLVEANNSEPAWAALTKSISGLFGYELLPPDPTGADIVAEYRMKLDGPALDIASAGMGFQQVLMLLTFLNTRPASVLLLDEPDAHLHVILQDAIYNELRSVALRQKSQLVIATHSEVIINSVEPRELYVMLSEPRPLADKEEKARLISSLRVLDNMDVMRAADASGIVYTEDYTDLNILREWARILGHPIHVFLTTGLFWHPCVWECREGAEGIRAEDHYKALKLVRDDLSGVMLLDGDARPTIQATEINGQGLQRLRWKRYEIESYLLHPAALARYVTQTVGEHAAGYHVKALLDHFRGNYPPQFIERPLDDIEMVKGTKARTTLMPPALDAAGIIGLPYTRYNEIAAVMLPEEIHPEVKEKLDAIQRALRL